MGGTRLAAEWTIREVLNWTRGYFKTAGIVQPRLEAEILLAFALDVDRLHLYLAPDKPLTETERTRSPRHHQAATRTGHRFSISSARSRSNGLRFKVNQDALVPRPETEELLDRMLRLTPRDREIRCLDLGTGSRRPRGLPGAISPEGGRGGNRRLGGRPPPCAGERRTQRDLRSNPIRGERLDLPSHRPV